MEPAAGNVLLLQLAASSQEVPSPPPSQNVDVNRNATVSVAALNDVEPPLLIVSTLVSARPDVWSQARKVTASFTGVGALMVS